LLYMRLGNGLFVFYNQSYRFACEGLDLAKLWDIQFA
jgi:hypothetical protein